MSLTDQQIADYNEEGYLIIRNALSNEEATDLRQNVRQLVHANELSFPASLKYPKPGKYTISGNNLAAPGLAPIAEHPVIVDAVESLLGQKSYLTAYVAYLRSPGDKGGGAHNDYKRWRPVGSSMNWLFAIIPLTDFNATYGPLEVSPGSHKLAQHIKTQTHILDVIKPEREQLADFVDPELKAGDLLLMNGHTWHNPPAGATPEDRVGIFNKYCAVHAPPAAGYYPYNSATVNAMSDEGKRLLPVCFDKPLSTTRLLFENEESKYLLLQDENEEWQLPGGKGWEEEKAGWDIGSRIASLQEAVKEQLDQDIPWMSYIEDVEEADGICRVYGFTGDTPELSTSNHNWLTQNEIQTLLGENNDISRAIETWHRDDIIRGKGKSVAQSKQQYE